MVFREECVFGEFLCIWDLGGLKMLINNLCKT